MENGADEFGGQAMNELFLFTPITCLGSLAPRQLFRPLLGGSAPKPPEFFCIRPMGLMAVGFGPRESIAPARGPEAKAPLAKPAAPVLNRLCPVLFRPRQKNFRRQNKFPIIAVVSGAGLLVSPAYLDRA